MKTCKDCLHYEVCNPYTKITAELSRDEADKEPCKYATDRSEWVHLPCAEGTRVYSVENNTDACYNCIAYDHFNSCCECKSTDSPLIAKLPVCSRQYLEVTTYNVNKNFILYHINDFGKTVFLTREEAEKALEILKDNNEVG